MQERYFVLRCLFPKLVVEKILSNLKLPFTVEDLVLQKIQPNYPLGNMPHCRRMCIVERELYEKYYYNKYNPFTIPPIDFTLYKNLDYIVHFQSPVVYSSVPMDYFQSGSWAWLKSTNKMDCDRNTTHFYDWFHNVYCSFYTKEYSFLKANIDSWGNRLPDWVIKDYIKNIRNVKKIYKKFKNQNKTI